MYIGTSGATTEHVDHETVQNGVAGHVILMALSCVSMFMIYMLWGYLLN